MQTTWTQYILCFILSGKLNLIIYIHSRLSGIKKLWWDNLTNYGVIYTFALATGVKECTLWFKSNISCLQDNIFPRNVHAFKKKKKKKKIKISCWLYIDIASRLVLDWAACGFLFSSAYRPVCSWECKEIRRVLEWKMQQQSHTVVSICRKNETKWQLKSLTALYAHGKKTKKNQTHFRGFQKEWQHNEGVI